MSTINENIETLRNIKEDIKDSLQAKGAPIDDETPFADYSYAIDELPTGGGGEEDIVRDSVSHVCSSKYALSTIGRESTTRNVVSDYHCQQTILNVTQHNGILYPNGIYQGGSNCYLELLQTAPLSTANSWEFRTKYTFNGGGYPKQIIGYTGSSDFQTPYLAFQNGDYLTLALSSNGLDWDMTVIVSDFEAQYGETYYIKFGFDGTKYYVDYNTMGWDSLFTNVITHTSSTKVYCNVPFMLMNLGIDTASYYSSGSMDLSETRLIINGSQWFVGAIIQDIF